MEFLFLILAFISFGSLIIALLKPIEFQRFFKKEVSRGKLGLYFGGATILFFILFVAIMNPVEIENVSTTNKQPSTTISQSRCESVPNKVISALEGGLEITDGKLSGVSAVKSNAFEEVYFIAAELNGLGLEDNGDIVIFAKTGLLTDSGMYFSINGLAKSFSVFPSGADSKANITIIDDSAKEAQKCASAN